MSTRAAPPQGEPGRLKVETGRPQLQHSSSAASAAASHPPPGFGTRSQPCQHLEGRELSPSLCARTPPLLSALPGSARPARPGADTSLGDRRCAATGRAGAGAGCCGSSPLPRAAAGARVPGGCGKLRHFRTIPPTRSLLPPPLVAGAVLSPSPCLRLPRPFPAPPSPLGLGARLPGAPQAPRRVLERVGEARKKTGREQTPLLPLSSPRIDCDRRRIAGCSGRWDSNLQSNLYGSKRKEGARVQCCRQCCEPGDGERRRLLGKAGTARGRRRLKVGKDAGAAPGTARKGMQIQQAWQESQSLPEQRCRPSGLRSLQSFQMLAADADVCFYTRSSVYHLGLPPCPVPVSVSKAFG
ncbi:uncharacterized protein LOC120765829 [Hirundo rustica]|uniref:uncharacterized protein LOC120765829 n=1 Tax=Hirundo rustica TaxID=43150 RepID=UPI001A941437|nr:uncharacterized protein LOC120765829 [Hirundo rustica]